MTRNHALAACAALLLVPHVSRSQEKPSPGTPGAASSSAPTEADRKKLEEEIAKQLGQPSGAPAPRPATPGVGGRDLTAPPGAPSARAAGASPYARLLFLPDVSAIGRAAIAFNDYDVETLSPRGGSFSPEGEPRALLEELEVGLQAIVDPYLRGDVFLAFSPAEGVDVEEAYVTTLSLPHSLQARAGKFFAPFGRMTQQHPHVWEFVDAPLAIGRLLADETISGAGVELGWLAPLPWFAEVRLAGISFAPGEDDPDALTGIARLLQYFALGETTTLGVGLSAARRDEGRSAFRDLGGVDAHVRWRPPASRSYVSLQGELWGRRFRGVEDAPGTETGGYGQVFWKRGPYHGVGARYDWAPAADGAGRERRIGVLAGWFPSEFQRIRLQVSYDRRPGGGDGIEALLHLEFGFGAHGAHPF
jgi:hypothetical protein